jgi:hypothetical protein
MSVYNGYVRSITASTTDDNWTVVGTAATMACRVLSVAMSGEATTSTAMHTRHARSTGQNGTWTLGTTEKSDPNSPAGQMSFATTFATTQPTLSSGDLLAMSWNAHGGIMYWHSGSPDEEWFLIGASVNVNISSRNSVGTGTSSYGCSYREA